MTSTEEKEYRRAYKEVVTILNVFSEELRDLIPNEKLEFYRNNMDETYEFKFDNTKEIVEQNILYQTKCILANLFRDYIATEKDRAEIIKKEQEELRKIEESKRKKYNPDDIFKNNFNKITEQSNIETEQIIVEEKNANIDIVVKYKNISLFENIKSKIISFIKKLKIK